MVSPVSAEECSLCAPKVIVVPATAPCLARELELAKTKTEPILGFDLSKCQQATKERGVVPGLPSVGDLKPTPTLRFYIQKIKLGCLIGKYEALQGTVDPYAQIKLDDCQ